MKYADFVAENNFGEFQKAAADLANVLDHPLFQITESEKDWGFDPTKKREEAFNLLCALCVQAQIPAPPLELAMLKAICFNKTSESNTRRAEEVLSQVLRRVSEPDHEAVALAKTLTLFSGIMSYGSIDQEKIMAAINQRLIEAGLEPIRPDYGKINLNFPINRRSPPQPIRALIVDDLIDAAMATLINLAGWPKLSFDFYHFNPSDRQSYRVNDERKTEMVNEVCAAIEQNAPDMVLMDEGLGQINGSDVVSAMKDHCSSIVFVGNTDGNDNKLRAAGATETCAKGSKWSVLEEAIKRFF